MTDTLEIRKVAFEGPSTPDRGYTVRASYLKPPRDAEALVELFKDSKPVRQFTFPAYKVWNIAAHLSDIVDSEIERNTKGLEAAAWDGISGAVVVSPQSESASEDGRARGGLGTMRQEASGMADLSLKELVLALADARGDLERAKGALAKAQAEFDAEHAGAIGLVAEYSAEVKGIEADIRAREYAIDVRQPAPGLTVKLVTQLTYSESQAHEWAIDNRHWSLLLLDTKAFERAAGALRPDFVTVARVPSVSIARDLSEARATIGAEIEAEAAVRLVLAAMHKVVASPAEEAGDPDAGNGYMATMFDAQAEAEAQAKYDADRAADDQEAHEAGQYDGSGEE
ncbi:MAG: hypothetical protein ACYC5O_00705 [Anaerolineae bacterium]